MKIQRSFSFLLPVLFLAFLANGALLDAKESMITTESARPIDGHHWGPFGLFDDSPRTPIFSNLGHPSGLTVYEDEKHFVVQASLPGLEAGEIDVEYDRGTLRIKGERKEGSEDKNRNYYHKAVASYGYNIHIPHKINESKSPIAEYKNGLMSVTFEKLEESQPKKIKVEKR